MHFNNTEGHAALLIGDVNLGPRNPPLTVLGGLWFGVLVVLAAIVRYELHVRLWWRDKRSS